MRTFVKRLIRWQWLPVILWMGVIFAASATPESQIHNFGTWDLLVKKGGHFLAYALLGIFLLRALGERRPRAWMIALVVAALFAASDELHQIFTSGRHPSPLDVVLDGVGAAAGILFWLQRSVERHKTAHPPDPPLTQGGEFK